jgi:hypothetical protein
MSLNEDFKKLSAKQHNGVTTDQADEKEVFLLLIAPVCKGGVLE